MDFTKEEEFQIVDDILNGNRNRYRVLVDQYAPMVFSIVRRFVDRSEDEIEELAQQIFVKAYERLSSFKKNSKFSTWLYTLARNHCLDYGKNVRRSNREFSSMDRQELNDVLKYEQLPDSKIQAEELGTLLELALSRITPLYAEAFLMKYRDDMTYKAMANRLDAKESALKVRVHRARKELQTFINKTNT